MKEKENREENKKKKVKKKKKRFNANKLFIHVFQSHLTYFPSLYKDKIILKCINF